MKKSLIIINNNYYLLSQFLWCNLLIDIPSNKAKLLIKILSIFFQLIKTAVKIVHNRNEKRINIQTLIWNVLINELNSFLILEIRDKIAISFITSKRRPNCTCGILSWVGLKFTNETSTFYKRLI